MASGPRISPLEEFIGEITAVDDEGETTYVEILDGKGKSREFGVERRSCPLYSWTEDSHQVPRGFPISERIPCNRYPRNLARRLSTDAAAGEPSVHAAVVLYRSESHR